MVSLLNIQLQNLASRNKHLHDDWNIQGKSQARSILYTSKEASDQNLDFVYDVGMEGVNGLAQLNPWWELYLQHIHSGKSLVFKHKLDRSLMTREENKGLDMEINLVLKAVSPFLLVSSGQQVMEYLIRTCRVTEMNVDSVMASILSYHETSLFPKILRIMSLNRRWNFLKPVQEHSISPTRSFLIDRGFGPSNMILFLHFFIQSIMDNKELATSISFSTQISFYTVFFVETIDRWPVEKIREHLGIWGRPLIKAMEVEHSREWKQAQYVVLVALAKRLGMIGSKGKNLKSNVEQALGKLLDACRSGWKHRSDVIQDIVGRVREIPEPQDEIQRVAARLADPSVDVQMNGLDEIRAMMDGEHREELLKLVVSKFFSSSDPQVLRAIGTDFYPWLRTNFEVYLSLGNRSELSILAFMCEMFQKYALSEQADVVYETNMEKIQQTLADIMLRSEFSDPEKWKELMEMFRQTEMNKIVFEDGTKWNEWNRILAEKLYVRALSGIESISVLLSRLESEQAQLEFLVDMLQRHFGDVETVEKTLLLISHCLARDVKIPDQKWNGFAVHLGLGMVSSRSGIRKLAMDIANICGDEIQNDQTFQPFFQIVVQYHREILADRAQIQGRMETSKLKTVGRVFIEALMDLMKRAVNNPEPVDMFLFVFDTFLGVRDRIKVSRRAVKEILSMEGIDQDVYGTMVVDMVERCVDDLGIVEEILHLGRFGHVVFIGLEKHWNEMNEKHRDRIVGIALEKYLDGKDMDAKMFLAKIAFHSRHVVRMLEVFVSEDEHTKRPKHESSSNDVDKLIDVLEFVEAKDLSTLEDYYVLIPWMFRVLEGVERGEDESFSRQSKMEWIRQVVLGCLDRLFEHVVESGQDVDETVMKIDLVVDLLRGSNMQTQLLAVALICTMSRLAPTLVFNAVLPVFVFMGSLATKMDDRYTFHVIETTIRSLVPILLGSDMDESRPDMEGSRDLIVQVFVDAFPHIPTHRRVPLFRLLIEAIPSEGCLRGTFGLRSVILGVWRYGDRGFVENLCRSVSGAAVVDALLHYVLPEIEDVDGVRWLLGLVGDVEAECGEMEMQHLTMCCVEWCRVVSERAGQRGGWEQALKMSEDVLEGLYGE